MKLEDFTNDQRRAMLAAIREREGGRSQADLDTGIVRNGTGVGLSEDESFALFKLLVDEHFVYPGRSLQAGAMRRGTTQVVGRGDSLTVVGPNAHLTDKGRAEFE